MMRIKYEERDGIAIIKLSRSEKLNAFDYDMWIEFKNSVKKASRTRGIIITGEGRAFSAGDDIYAMYRFKDYRDAKRFFDVAYQAFKSTIIYSGPVVAALNGFAVGGGGEIILLVDYVISVKDAWIWYPESRIGLFPPLLSTIGIHVLGLKTVKKLMYLLPRLSADECLKLGLIDEIVEDKDDLINKAIEAVKKLLKIPSSAYIYSKRVIARQYSDIVKYALEELSKATLDEGAKELMKQFIEKKS